ncbi:MAG: dGTPase, partial [Polaribacter sp.]|nr:dGTPase [Polaribacter sp.]
DTIDIKKYHSLQHKKDRVSYLRALAIGVLINEAVDIFLANEAKILTGEFERSLLDKCKFEAQINDIIKISVAKIYQSKEVIEKEVAGYKILADLLDVFITAFNNEFYGNASNYDKLILRMLPEQYQVNSNSTYQRIMSICSYVSGMSDGFAIRLHKKLTGNSI